MIGLNRYLLIAVLVAQCASGRAIAQEGGAHPVNVAAFRIRAPNGATSLLLGSFHGRDSRVIQPSPSIFEGAKYFVVEHPSGEGELLGSGGIGKQMDPGSFLRMFQTGKITPAAWVLQLTIDQVSELRRRLKCHLPLDMKDDDIATYLAMRPQLVSYIAAYPCDEGQPKSRDELLFEYAKNQATPIVSLESSVEVQRQRDAVPDELWAKALSKILENDPRTYSDLIAAINAGDYDGVASIVDRFLPDRHDAELFHVRMVSERNAVWLPRLERFLDEGDAVVLVGAAHLPGPDGLLMLVRRDGYQVETTRLARSQ